MTEPPALPDLPRPDIFDSAGCKNGCYSGKQFDAALSVALGWGSACVDKLLGVRTASHKAATP